MTRRPAFWVLLGLLAAAAGGFAYLYAGRALPLVELEVTMGRAEALAAARELAAARGIGPEGYRQAASFSDPEPQVRTYAELEAGAADPFAALLEAGGYHAYRWQVRHFRAGEPVEAIFVFTPSGVPYGFDLYLPEDEPGVRLEPEAARRLAEAELPAWGVELGRYEPIDGAQEVRPGGRIDHAFVYRLAGVRLGAADFRLRVRVAGDRLAEVTPFVHVPEAFERRFAELRSANEQLTLGATAAFVLLFLVGGCGVGGLLLLRRRALLWRPALLWGVVVGAVVALALVNQLPLAWMSYDTAVPAGTFLAGRLALAAAALLLGAPLLGLIFAAAEGLTRWAFPGQPQQWRLWARGVANTAPALGRTGGGYLLALASLGYVVGFYLLAGRLDGWWMPSETLVQPDLLATFVPWLTAVAVALQAGFWEESLFRAVPIAAAALLGARLGRRRLWIGSALVLQAAVFAAAHADYPQMPYYARLVELFLPALGWGLVYLAFGLVPVILAHALYNLAWMSVPLFASSAPGIWLDRTAVIVIALLPLAWVLARTARDGLRAELPEEARNRAWRPPPAEPPPPEARPEPELLPAAGADWRWGLAAALAAGLALWAAARPWHAPVPPLSPERSVALAAAERERMARGLGGDGEAEADWRLLAAAEPASSEAHRFVWQEGGEEAFRSLLGSYLEPPRWSVRAARFTGPVEERAEELKVEIDSGGGIARLHHRLPEARESAELDAEEARRIARRALAAAYGLGPEAPEVSAEAVQRPGRRDWSFVFSDPASYPLATGAARVTVGVAGDRVVERFRHVHVPEEWQRAQRGERARRAIAGGVIVGLTLLAFGAAAVAGAVGWARGRFDLRAALAAAGLLAAVAAFGAWNRFPGIAHGFETALAFEHQALGFVLLAAIAVPIATLPVGLAIGFAHAWRPPQPRPAIPPALAGAALGAAAAGLAAFFGRTLLPATEPALPSLAGADASLPAAAAALGPAVPFVTTTALLLLALTAIKRSGRRARGGRPLALLAALGAGVLLAGSELPGGPAAWVAAAVLAAGAVLLLARLARRLHLALVPPLVAVPALLAAAVQAVQAPFPGARPGALAGAALIAALAWIWCRALAGDLEKGPAPAETHPEDRAL